jgi:hypothetical protein
LLSMEPHRDARLRKRPGGASLADKTGIPSI